MSEPAETYSDQILSFTLPARHGRGRLVRLGPVVNHILEAHDYPGAIRHLLAEALVLAALTGSLLKEPGDQLTMQAQTEGGVVKLLVCDYRHGELRGYVDFDAERLAALGANPSLFALFGKGYLAITFDTAQGKGRYQGIVPLEGDSLAQACQSYFIQSEQVPTLIRTAVRLNGDHCEAAGLLAQHLADGEEGRERLHVRLDQPEWEHVAVIAGSIRHDELLDQDLSMEAIAWRLFHEEEEVRVQAGNQLQRGCRCSIQHFKQVLGRFPEEDRKDMRDVEGTIPVDCAFCSKIFRISM